MMKVNKNIVRIAESAMTGIDRVGYELDMYGITSKVNRHNLIGLVMSEQKYLEGELDSLTARIDSTKVKLENTLNKAEAIITNAINLVLAPARSTVSSVKGLLG